METDGRTDRRTRRSESIIAPTCCGGSLTMNNFDLNTDSVELKLKYTASQYFVARSQI